MGWAKWLLVLSRRWSTGSRRLTASGRSESVKLSEIARALHEEIAVKKTHERLVRQLGREGLGERLQENVLRYAAGHVGTDSLLVLDVSEVTKPYARKMGYLCKVRDGTDGQIKYATAHLRPGYSTMNVIATDTEGKHIVALYHKLYSANARSSSARTWRCSQRSMRCASRSTDAASG